MGQDDGTTCQETAGFLFKHPCDGEAYGYCNQCQKATCRRHTHAFGEDALCTGCAKTEVREGKRKGHRYGQYEDDPYFYGESYYPGYGRYGAGRWGYAYYSGSHHDPDDFTEADGESLRVEGDEAWEQDMGAS